MKQRKRLFFAILAAALLAPPAVFWFSDYRGSQRQIDAIHADGFPASPLELDRWYKPVPASSNRALAIMEAANFYIAPAQALNGKIRRFVSADADKVSPEEIALVQKVLRENKEVLAQLYACPDLPGSRYPVDFSSGPNTLLPHLAGVRNLVELLRFDVVWQSRQKNVAGAVRSLKTVLAVADSLRNEPIVISEYVRLKAVGQSVDAFSRLLSEHELTDEQLVSLDASLAQAEAAARNGLVRALAGERGCNLAVFDMSFSELDRLGAIPPVERVNPLFLPLLSEFYRASGMRQRDFLCYLEVMDELISAAKLDFPERLTRFEQVEAGLSNRFSGGLGRFSVISRNLLVPLGQASLKEANSSTALRCARVALAIERFRLAHGRTLPDDLNELAPAYMDKLPADPYDGRPLSFERAPSNGYRVFAAGAVAANRAYISINTANLAFVLRR